MERPLRSRVFLLVVVVGLFVAAIYISPDRRRTIRDCGTGLAVVALIALLGRRFGINALVGELRSSDSDEPSLSILEIGSSLLRQIAQTELLIGLTLIVFAVVAGPSRVARSIRKGLAPLLRHGTVSMIVGGIVVFLFLLWIKPGGPLDSWFVAVIVAALCVAGIGWVQRETITCRPIVGFPG